MTDLVSFRPEIIRDVNSSDAPVVAKTIGWAERIYRLGFVRKGLILAVLAIAWEAYGRWLGNPLLFPTFGQTVQAFVENIVNGIIPQRMLVSLQTLVIGYSIGIVLAALLTTLAIGSRIGAGLGATAQPAASPIPADFDTAAFVRNAKSQFLALQAANDARDLDRLRDYLTPEMFEVVREEILERGTQPQRTEVFGLEGQVLEVAQESDRYIVSVRFTGSVREQTGAAPEPLDEVWHLAKPRWGNGGWVIAGIQQVATE